MARFFLSYASHPDADLAKAVAVKLRTRKHDVFYDKDSLKTGSDFDARIRAEINRCDILVLFLRKASIVEGHYTRTELRIAEERWPNPLGRICAVELENVESDTLPYPLVAVTKITPTGNLATDIADAAETMARDLDPHADDWVQLTKASGAASQDLNQRAQLRWGDHDLQPVERELLTTIETELQRASLIVTGDAGDGKSSLMAALYERLTARGARVALLRVDEITSPTLDGVRGDLGLSSRLEAIIAGTVGCPPFYLLVDGVEAFDDTREATWKKIVGTAVRDAKRWRVAISIRLATLEAASTWKEMFHGTPVAAHVSPATRDVRHVTVPPFTNAELSQLLAPVPEALKAVSGAPRRVRELLATPFNLQLMMQTVSPESSLADLRSQRVLLDRYWQKRVRGARSGLDRVAILKGLASGDVDRTDAAVVGTSPLRREALDGLVTDGVLRRNYLNGYLAFSHDLLEDYVQSLILSEDPGAVDTFAARPTLVKVNP